MASCKPILMLYNIHYVCRVCPVFPISRSNNNLYFVFAGMEGAAEDDEIKMYCEKIQKLDVSSNEKEGENSWHFLFWCVLVN